MSDNEIKKLDMKSLDVVNSNIQKIMKLLIIERKDFN